jgi:hypothetical protein
LSDYHIQRAAAQSVDNKENSEDQLEEEKEEKQSQLIEEDSEPEETNDNNSPPMSQETNTDTVTKNSPPEAGGGTVNVQSGGTVEINLAASDPYSDEEFTFHIQDQPNNGELGEFDGNVIPYTSNEGFVGIDSFTFTVRDGQAGMKVEKQK